MLSGLKLSSRLIRLLGAAALLVWAGAPASFGANNEPMSRFWLNTAPETPPPLRRRSSGSVRPWSRRPAVSVERRVAPEQPPAPPPQTAKAAVAASFVVGVFGDDNAASVARGLSIADEAAPSTTVVDGSGDDGELTRTPIATWRATLDTAVAQHGRIDVAIVMLGGDEVGLDLKGDEAGTPGGQTDWRKAYGEEVEALAALFRDRKIPLLWVGLSPVRDEAESRRFLELNEIFRERAAKTGATYVDSWEAFTDDNGQYTPNGPDVDGQPAKLRRSDGRGFTKAGAVKLASFVESDLKSERDKIDSSQRLASVPIDDQKAFDQALQIDVNAQIRREAGLPAGNATGAGVPEPPTTDGPVISLTAAPVTADGRLATLYDSSSRPSDTAASTLDRGLTPPSRPGRADDFSWPRP